MRRTVVLVRGPTGSGREIVAQAVHALLARTGRRGDFVAMNCAAVSATLIEAELFGARRSAFSGAIEDRPGLVRASHDGTMFRDEIGDLALASQAALLRVLETREVLPVGGSRPIPTDTAFVAATHRDLESMMSAGHFRADLYARLAGFEIHLPALRERLEDLGLIVAALIREAGAIDVRFGADATRALFVNDWPLNVRELKSALGRAVPLAHDGVVRSEHLTAPMKKEGSRSSRNELPDGVRNARDASLRERVTASLVEHQGNVAAVARALGEHRRQVQRWMDRFGLVADHYRVR